MSNENLTTRSPRLSLGQAFYPIASVLLMGVMLIGFAPFYLHGQAYGNHPLPAPVRSFLILHGAGMSAWGVIFMVQTCLIRGSQRSLHRYLGGLSAVLAVVLFVSGFLLAIRMVQTSPAGLMLGNLTPRQFMAIPVVNILCFAGFVAAGLFARRNRAFHRPMMLLATLSIMSAAISRIDSVSHWYQSTAWASWFGPFFGMLVLGLLLLVLQSLMTRSLDRRYLTGYLLLVAGSYGGNWLTTASLWAGISGVLLGV